MSLQNSLIFKRLVRMPNWDDHPLKNNLPGYGTKDTENKNPSKKIFINLARTKLIIHDINVSLFLKVLNSPLEKKTLQLEVDRD